MPITVTNVTELIATNNQQPIAYGQGGLEVEFFKVAFTGGISLGETVVLNPRWISDVRSVQSNLASLDNLDLSTRNSNVTLTLRSSQASTVDGSFTVSIIGRR